jgi:hypothetical protein
MNGMAPEDAVFASTSGGGSATLPLDEELERVQSQPRDVTDFIEPRSSVVVRPYCPSCEPDTDPTRDLVELRWCPAHAPAWGGSDDLLVTANALPGGSGEAGGEDNRRWCELIHGAESSLRQEKRRVMRGGTTTSEL